MNNIYKKGDKVRVIDQNGASDSYIGQILTVRNIFKSSVNSRNYYKFIEVPFQLREDRLELLKEFYEVYN